MVDAVENEYQWGLLGHAVASARDAGALLFVLVGGLIRPEHLPGRGENALFELIAPSSLDGIMLISASIGHLVSQDDLATWSRRFEPVPVSSIGLELPGYPSFVVENESGTFLATTHLAKHHGHRRIAFVQGAAGSREAEARLRGYYRGLEAAGLEADPRLIAPGDFTMVGGHAAVAHLLDRERVNPNTIDSIVAANDALAFGIIEELRTRDIEVPGKIAVVGFDDVMVARVGPPPLTTVRQPVNRLAASALRNLLVRIHGTPDAGAVLETELVVRRSCGCLAATPIMRQSSSGMRSASEVAILARREQIGSSLARTARGGMVGAGAGWEQRLLMAIVNDAREGGSHLLETTDALLTRLTRSGTDPTVLDDVLTGLRMEVVAALECGAALARAEDSFHDTRRVLHEELKRIHLRERAELTFAMQTLTQLSRQLRAPRDPATATEDFVRHTRALGCDAGIIAWLSDDLRKAHPIVHYDRGGLRQNHSFNASDLWPGNEPDCQTGALVFHPILVGESMVGYCGFALGTVDGSIHELLRGFVTERLRRGPSLHSAPPGQHAQ